MEQLPVRPQPEYSEVMPKTAVIPPVTDNKFIQKMTKPSNSFIARLRQAPLNSAQMLASTQDVVGSVPNTKPQPIGGRTYTDKRRGLTLSQDDIDEARAIMYGEVGSRSRDKKVLEANVVLNTALNRLKMIHDAGYKNITLKQVLSEPKQYQALGGSNYRLAKSGKVGSATDERMSAIEEVIEKMELGSLEDIAEGKIAYHHYDDPKTKERKIKLTKYKKAWAANGKALFE